MASFVHLAPEPRLPVIRRSGITPSVYGLNGQRGVFAMPVIADFQASHQWLRELRRFHAGRFAGVYFRVPDDEPVLTGRYNQAPVEMAAAQAVGWFQDEPVEGFQVFIPHRIAAKDIFRIKSLPQTIGWRFFPEAKGSKPFCGCPYCQKGRINGQNLIRRWEAGAL